MDSRFDTVRERLAAYAHEAWAGWMRYLFDRSASNDDGTVTIPAWAVERWRRQMATPYADLAASEHASDLEQADQILALIESAQPEPPDAEVEAIVDRCVDLADRVGTVDLLRRAVQAGREPLLRRIEELERHVEWQDGLRLESMKLGIDVSRARYLATEQRIADAKAEGYREGLEAAAVSWKDFDAGKELGARLEREACARIADDEEEAWQDGESNATTCRIIAAAIRSRGEPAPKEKPVCGCTCGWCCEHGDEDKP